MTRPTRFSGARLEVRSVVRRRCSARVPPCTAAWSPFSICGHSVAPERSANRTPHIIRKLEQCGCKGAVLSYSDESSLRAHRQTRDVRAVEPGGQARQAKRGSGAGLIAQALVEDEGGHGCRGVCPVGHGFGRLVPERWATCAGHPGSSPGMRAGEGSACCTGSATGSGAGEGGVAGRAKAATCARCGEWDASTSG